MKKRYIMLLSAAITAALSATATADTANRHITQASIMRAQFQRDSRIHTQLPHPPAIPAINPGTRLHKAADGTTTIPEIIGNVIWPQNAGNYLTMCALPTTPDGGMTVLSPSGVTSNGGGVEIDGKYWSASLISGEGYEEYFLFSYDATTWQQLSFTQTELGLMATDVALDPTSKKVYGCFYNDDGTGAVFGTVDYGTQVRTQIATLTTSWSGCAIDADGTLYAIDYYGVLFTVDKTTGEMTQIGETGLSGSYLTSACIDTHSGRLFYCHNFSQGSQDFSYLYEIDKTTARPTLIYQLPNNEQLVGMYVAPPKADWNAPAAPTALKAEFPGGTLNGTISFNAPETTYEGKPAEGTITYTITANGSEIASGETTYGATVSKQVTLPANGSYTIAATVANKAGTSPAAEIEQYIGHDTPLAPSVTAKWTGNGVTVSWEAITEGANGGFLDATAVTYTVTRLPEGTTVASDITGLTATDPVAEPESLTKFTYAVTASANGMTSQQGLSNTIGVGPITPPYILDFEDDNCFADLTIIDANKDANGFETARTWYRFQSTDGNHQARIKYNSALNMDDWLITPAMRLEAGKIYLLHFDVHKEGGAANIEQIEVKFGRGNTVADMTATAFERRQIDHNEYRTYTCRIEAAETGSHYIGFHGCSDKDKFWLDLDNIHLEAGAFASAPNVIENLQITPGAYGARKADIAFKTPSVTFDGAQLTELECATIYRDGTAVKTFEQPAVGSVLFFTDENGLEPGFHTYSITASNNAGEGKPTVAEVFIGTKKTVAPKAVKVAESTPGTVTVSWQAPDTDVDGTLINPAMLRYYVAEVKNGKQTVIAEAIPATSVTYTAVDEGEQAFVTFGIFAESDGGISDPAISAMTPVGTPYSLPYSESFANGTPSSIFGSVTDMGQAQWGVFTDKSVNGVTSADADNGFIGMEGQAYNDRASLLSGKIDLTGAAVPILEFQLFHMKGSVVNENPLEILADNGNGFMSIQTIEISQTGTENQWNRIVIPLPEYAGKVVTLKFAGKVDTYKYTFLDDIRLYDESSAIETINNDGDTAAGITVSAGQGHISIEGAQNARVSIHNTAGIAIFSTAAAPSSIIVPAAPGLYIVQAGATVTKVAVR